MGRGIEKLAALGPRRHDLEMTLFKKTADRTPAQIAKVLREFMRAPAASETGTASSLFRSAIRPWKPCVGKP
jgi:hypothetical protein